MDEVYYPCLESLTQRRKVSLVELQAQGQLPGTPKSKVILNISSMETPCVKEAAV